MHKKKLCEKNRNKIGTIEDPQYAKALEILTQEIAGVQSKKAQ